MNKILIIGSSFFNCCWEHFSLINKSTPPENQNKQDEQTEQTLLLTDTAQIEPRNGLSQDIRNTTLAPLVTISANPPAVEYGGTPVIISWKSTNATSCVSSDGDILRLSGSMSIAPSENYTLKIICTNSKGTAGESVTVPVTRSPIIALSVYPETVKLGAQSSILWSTINATNCVDGEGNTLRLNDSLSVTPKKTYTFNINCDGPDGAVKKSVTIAVVSPPAPTKVVSAPAPVVALLPLPLITFISSPTTVQSGQTATLSWAATNATSCTASGSWSGAKEISGSEKTASLVGPLTNTYKLTCRGSGGSVTQSVTVKADIPFTCPLSWGGSLSSGKSVSAYQSPTVPYGSTCISETRTCSNGTLSGTYANKSCAVAGALSCATPWEQL